MAPSSRSSSRRAAVPIALIIAAAAADHDALLGLGLHPQQRADGDQVAAVLDLLDVDLDRVRDLLAGAGEHLLAHELGEQDGLGLVGDLLGREVERALGQQRGEVVDERLRRRCPVRAETGKTSASSPSVGGGRRAPRPCAVFDVRSTLLTAMTTGTFAPRERLGDPAVAGAADALVAVDDEQRRVGLARAPARRGAACAA